MEANPTNAASRELTDTRETHSHTVPTKALPLSVVREAERNGLTADLTLHYPDGGIMLVEAKEYNGRHRLLGAAGSAPAMPSGPAPGTAGRREPRAVRPPSHRVPVPPAAKTRQRRVPEDGNRAVEQP